MKEFLGFSYRFIAVFLESFTSKGFDGGTEAKYWKIWKNSKFKILIFLMQILSKNFQNKKKSKIKNFAFKDSKICLQKFKILSLKI